MSQYTRSMAAYKAHLTRQTNAAAAAHSAAHEIIERMKRLYAAQHGVSLPLTARQRDAFQAVLVGEKQGGA